MKTNELIELLKKEDPNNECEVCIDNKAIYYVERLPYYYDGRLEFVECNKQRTPIKCGWRTTSPKVKIRYYDLEDVIVDDIDIAIEYCGVSYNGKIQQEYIDFVNKCIEEGKDHQKWLEEYRKSNPSTSQSSILEEVPKLSWKERFLNWINF